MLGTARLRRLYKEYELMRELVERSPLIDLLTVEGDPPERYLVGFKCRGVARLDANQQPVISSEHRVELVLTAQYPRMRPLMRWLTPIFHPNFNLQGNVCIKEWYPQQTLSELCEVLVEMVQYKNYNTTSPLNLDAALWGMRYRDQLPIDRRSLWEPEGIAEPAPATPTVSSTSERALGSVPIWAPLQEIKPAVEPARFCEKCGFQYEQPDVRSCPRCGARRTTIYL